MMDMNAPRVLVIVLNYRTAEMTLRAAAAALADMPQGAELILVDNASGDGSGVILQNAITAKGWDAQGRVRLILSAVNGGFGAGNNLGLACAMSDGSAPDYFYVLNSDAFPDPGCLSSLIAHLQNHPKAGFAGSHVRGEDDLDHCTAFRFPSIAGEFEGAARLGVMTRLLAGSVVAPALPQTSAKVDWVAGASVLIRARMLREIGVFDENFFLYFEETDLCKRASRAGWDCWYVPDSRVVHIGSVSTGMKNWQRMPAYWFQSRQYYFLKNHSRPYAAAALLARFAGGAIHHLRCAVSGRNVQDPSHFLRDLARHGLGLLPRLARATPRHPATEDRP